MFSVVRSLASWPLSITTGFKAPLHKPQRSNNAAGESQQSLPAADTHPVTGRLGI